MVQIPDQPLVLKTHAEPDLGDDVLEELLEVAAQHLLEFALALHPLPHPAQYLLDSIIYVLLLFLKQAGSLLLARQRLAVKFVQQVVLVFDHAIIKLRARLWRHGGKPL